MPLSIAGSNGDDRGMNCRTSLWLLLALAACAGKPAPRTPPVPIPPPHPPAPAFQVENGAVVLPVAVQFTTGRAVPTPASDEALRHVVAFLAAKPAITLLRVEAHTSGEADAVAEQTLSEGRAMAVCLRLVEMGADEARLLPVGFGSAKPRADGSTPAGRAQNARIEFHPAAMNGKPIGGLPVDGGGKVAGPAAK